MRPSFHQAIVMGLSAVVILLHASETLPRYQSGLTGRFEDQKEPGHRFADIKPFLSQVTKAGYLTDRALTSESLDVVHFLAAQYELVPCLLDMEQAHHRFLILDFADPDSAFRELDNLKAVPIYINPHQIILAERQ